jgi:hypothetical protein
MDSASSVLLDGRAGVDQHHQDSQTTQDLPDLNHLWERVRA